MCYNHFDIKIQTPIKEEETKIKEENMQEIKCPKCGEVFQIDEAGYAEIVKQVRNREFNEELQRQKAVMDSEKKTGSRSCRFKILCRA